MIPYWISYVWDWYLQISTLSLLFRSLFSLALSCIAIVLFISAWQDARQFYIHYFVAPNVYVSNNTNYVYNAIVLTLEFTFFLVLNVIEEFIDVIHFDRPFYTFVWVVFLSLTVAILVSMYSHNATHHISGQAQAQADPYDELEETSNITTTH